MNPKFANPRLALLPAFLAVAASALFIRFADAPPVAVAFWRAAFAGIAFLPLFIIPVVREQWRGFQLRDFLLISAATFIIAISTILFVSSLHHTSVAASVVLTNTQPIFVAIFGHLLFRERVSKRAVWGLLGAVVGVVIISLSHGGVTTPKGNFLALGASLCGTIYTLCARRLRQRTPIIPFILTVQIANSVFLFLIAGVFGVPLVGFDAASWRALLVLGLVPTFIGHTLLMYAIGYLKAYSVSLVIIGEPVGAAILAAIFLGEIPTWLTITGGIVVLLSIYIALSEKEKLPSTIAVST